MVWNLNCLRLKDDVWQELDQTPFACFVLYYVSTYLRADRNSYCRKLRAISYKACLLSLS